MQCPLWLLALLAFALATVCDAQDIHKCVAGGEVSYQNIPCAPGEVEARLPRLPGYADPAQRDGATSPPTDTTFGVSPDALQVSPAPALPDAQDAFPFRTSIALGMTDDQVLNIPDWGRPTRIARSGHRQGFREVWTYDRGGARRQLAFVGGRLAAIDAADAPVSLADHHAGVLAATASASGRLL